MVRADRSTLLEHLYANTLIFEITFKYFFTVVLLELKKQNKQNEDFFKLGHELEA